MGQDFIKTLFESRGALQSISRTLDGMSNAFDATGNRAMAERLGDISDHLTAIGNELVDAHGRMQSEFLSESQRDTMSNLRALIERAG